MTQAAGWVGAWLCIANPAHGPDQSPLTVLTASAEAVCGPTGGPIDTRPEHLLERHEAAFLYYVGHGRAPDSELELPTSKGAIPFRAVLETQDGPGRDPLVAILDGCDTGYLDLRGLTRPTSVLSAGYGAVIGEPTPRGRAPFSEVIAEGLRGDADAKPTGNCDGTIDDEELAAFADVKIREMAFEARIPWSYRPTVVLRKNRRAAFAIRAVPASHRCHRPNPDLSRLRSPPPFTVEDHAGHPELSEALRRLGSPGLRARLEPSFEGAWLGIFRVSSNELLARLWVPQGESVARTRARVRPYLPGPVELVASTKDPIRGIDRVVLRVHGPLPESPTILSSGSQRELLDLRTLSVAPCPAGRGRCFWGEVPDSSWRVERP